MKIVFFGSGEFGFPTLAALSSAGHSIVSVVTGAPKPAGRGRSPRPSEIESYARTHNMPVLYMPADSRDAAFIEALKQYGADIFVVIAFRILPREVFTIPRLSTVNLHASLLPGYRGPAPIHRAIAAGETKTGVTVFAIDDGIDTGRILMQSSTDIGPEETTPQLAGRLSEIGATAMLQSLDLLEHGTAPGIEQSSTGASRAPKLTKAEGLLLWNRTAVENVNIIRGFKPFPGTYTFINDQRVGIELAEAVAGDRGEPGEIIAVGPHGFDIRCGDGVLRAKSVKPEGKKVMDAGAYVNGYRIAAGMRCS